MTLQPEKLGGVGSIPGRVTPLKRHDGGGGVADSISALLHLQSQRLALKTATSPSP